MDTITSAPNFIPEELVREYDISLPPEITPLENLNRITSVGRKLGGMILGPDDEPSGQGDDNPTTDPKEGREIPAHTLPDPDEDDD